jgi:hypothetical protein
VADFFVGEHGDPLQLTMPFDASGEAIVIEAAKPDGTVADWSSGYVLTSSSVTRTVAVNDLDVAGFYRIVVTATRASPARVRKVAFLLVVGSPR